MKMVLVFHFFLMPVLARQPSRAADPLLRSSRGVGGWGPPLCIGKLEVGTYIYSRTYTAHGTLGNFFEVFTAANVMEGSVDPFRWPKKPPALPFAAFHHPPWDYSIALAYGLAPP